MCVCVYIYMYSTYKYSNEVRIVKHVILHQHESIHDLCSTSTSNTWKDSSWKL